jgi:hypothetical protein
MPQPRIEVLGAYRVDASPELFAEAMQLKYPYEFSSPEARLEAEEHVRSEIFAVVLFELLVRERDGSFSVDHFGQEGSDQAAYCEVFLSEDGESVISDDRIPPNEPLRMAFFLHYVDSAKPLRTSYGAVAIPTIQPMAARLKSLAPYEPVD